MRSPELPEDGPVRVGPVSLPPGRRVAAFEGGGRGQPVAWVTGVDVPDPGPVWSALSDLRGQTGLVPVLLEGGEDDQAYFFCRPGSSAEIDRLEPATVMTALWDGMHEDTSGPAVMFDAPLSKRFLGLDRPPPGGHSLADIAGAIFKVMTDPAANEELSRLNEIDRRNAGWPPAGYGEPEPEPGAEPEPFPGMAPPADGRLTRAERDNALASLAPARIGLVPAARPADVPAAVGWMFGVNLYEYGPVQASGNAAWGAVLRSFEDRFGATLLKLGPGAEMRLLVERPPRTLEHATRIAAEHSVFCNECAGQGLRTVPEIAAALVGAPIWTFWWD